jgi:type IV secretion system protein VirD4
MDAYLRDPENLSNKARAEKYAKITAKTIISSGGLDSGNYGQNAFFYDAAEGLLTATILLIAEFCPPEKRHIVSVFKIIQDLLAPSPIKGKNQFQILIEKLPPNHKARWFAGAALNTAEQVSGRKEKQQVNCNPLFCDCLFYKVLLRKLSKHKQQAHYHKNNK